MGQIGATRVMAESPSNSAEKDSRTHALFVWLCLASFTEPVVFSYIAEVHALYSFLKIICTLCIVIYSVMIYFKKLKINIKLLQYIIFWTSFIIPAIVYNSIIGPIQTIINMLSIGLLFSIELSLFPRLFLKRVQALFFVYVVSSFALSILFPNGFGIYIPGYIVMEDSTLNLLGLDNSLIYPIIILIVTSYVCQELGIDTFQSLRLSPTMISIICLLYEVYVWSGTGLIAVVFATLLMVLIARQPFITKCFHKHFTTIVLIYLIIVASLVLFDFYTSMIDIFQDILNKGSSLLGRATLWSTAIDMIKASPVFGLGLGTQVLSINQLMYSPHNLILQILLYGGFISLVLFISLLLLYSHSTASVNDNVTSSRCVAYTSAALLSFLIVGLTESCLINFTLTFLLFIGWYSPMKNDEAIRRVSS